MEGKIISIEDVSREGKKIKTSLRKKIVSAFFVQNLPSSSAS